MCTDCLDQPGTRHNVSFTHFVTTSHYTRFQIQHLVKGETVFNNMLHWCTFADYCSNFSLFIKIKLTNFHHRAAGCTTRPGGSLPNNYSPLVTGTINNKTHHKARMSLQHVNTPRVCSPSPHSDPISPAATLALVACLHDSQHS